MTSEKAVDLSAECENLEDYLFLSPHWPKTLTGILVKSRTMLSIPHLLKNTTVEQIIAILCFNGIKFPEGCQGE